ncbi:hypothetical protein ACGFJT_45425 [Actinomadura geliboluensis]|uniref:hypothetical protein n=1 Tax=Actinomadura geliboluensis TaxID=882440 RepID=UPI0037217131
MSLTRLAVIDDDPLGLAGPGADMVTACGADVAVGPDGTVIVTEAGDDLEASGVRNRDTFALVGPVPGEVAARFLAGWSSEPWLQSGPESQPIHLFVRVREGALYLGTVEQLQSGWGTDPYILEDCVLHIDPPLDVDALDRVRPPSTTPGALPGLEWLDHLDRDRTAALRMFIESWYPAPAEESAPATAAEIPPALAEFYRLIHGRPHVLGVQNFIRPSADLHLDEDGLLEFGQENQGVFYWALDPAGDDPVVWTIEAPARRQAEHERLSGFLVQFSLHEAVMSSPYIASTDPIPWPIARRLTDTMRRVPLKTWLWSQYETSFYAAPGLIARLGDQGDGQCDIWVGARHRSLLRPLGRIGVPWRSFDG